MFGSFSTHCIFIFVFAFNYMMLPLNTSTRVSFFIIKLSYVLYTAFLILIPYISVFHVILILTLHLFPFIFILIVPQPNCVFSPSPCGLSFFLFHISILDSNLMNISPHLFHTINLSFTSPKYLLISTCLLTWLQHLSCSLIVSNSNFSSPLPLLFMITLHPTLKRAMSHYFPGEHSDDA